MAGVTLHAVPTFPPPTGAHVDVFLLLPMVLDEVAGDEVELLTVALHLQDGALHMAQQLLVLRREGPGPLTEAAGAPQGRPAAPR